jgi:general secretion pathway protein D
MIELRRGAIVLAMVLVAGCATGRAVRSGQTAATRGDWDAAVAHYREAMVSDPDDVEVRVLLQRAMRMAAAEHSQRARQLEDQEQLPGAISEYRLAADFDPSNTWYLTKALQLERVLKNQIDAMQAQPRIDTLRQQATAQSPFPRLDPRQPVVASFPNAAARDILRSISEITGITISYDRGADGQLTQAYPIELTGEPIEAILQQILTAFNMTYKITGPRSILVYQDTAQNRQRYDDLYTQLFLIDHGDVAEIINLITQFTQGGTNVRPIIQQMKSANAFSVKASAQILQMIEAVVRVNDKPRAEIMLDVEILEVNRQRVKELGLDLSQYGFGVTLSPEFAPPNTGAQPGIPAMPPPVNLGTLAGGVTRNDFFVTIPSAMIRLLETDSQTKLLARPQLRGREGMPMTLNLGDEIPIPQTQFLAAAPGGVQNQPATQIQYRPVGVNMAVTPRVTYGDEIILENLQVQRSGLGGSLNVGGQDAPIIVSRTAVTTMRLRHGESNLLAGLIRNEDSDTRAGFSGLSRIPILGKLFGRGRREKVQLDVVMIITPYIVRGHEITADDLRPQSVGTAQNIGLGTRPQLIATGAPPPPGLAAPGTGTPVTPGAAGAPVTTGTPPPGGAGTPPRVPGVVPISAIGGDAQPAAGSGEVRLVPAGTEHPQGNVFATPIMASNLSQVGTITVTLTYNPAVLRATTVTQGTFMAAGGVTPTFAPKIDAAAGRVDIAISRPTDRPGATTVEQALLAAVNFQAVAPGTAQVTMTVVATTPTGQPVSVQAAPVTVTVK